MLASRVTAEAHALAACLGAAFTVRDGAALTESARPKAEESAYFIVDVVCVSGRLGRWKTCWPGLSDETAGRVAESCLLSRRDSSIAKPAY